MSRTSTPLHIAFDPRANGLNLFRLVLAASVIVTHSYPLTGHEERWGFLRGVGVDGFFAISGFLIAASWIRRPSAVDYLRARLIRILPGLWVCLVVTAAVIAPIATAFSGGRLPPDYASGASRYFLQNFILTDQGQAIAGTLTDVPYPDAWNSSLWTLRWEFFCYLGIMMLGLLGILGRKRCIIAIFAGLTFAQLVVKLGDIDSYWITSPVRFGLMFVSGTLVYVLRDRLPVSRGLVLASILVVAILNVATGGYLVGGAIFYAYALIAGSSFVRSSKFQLRNDISYGTYIYGFPVQQLLASTALVMWTPLAFAVVAILVTLPLAAASWFLVEKPAQRFRSPKQIDTQSGGTRIEA